VKRLDQIIYHEFPIPIILPPPPMNIEGELAPDETPRSTGAGLSGETIPASSIAASSGPQSSPSISRSTPPPSQIPATSTPSAVPNSQRTPSSAPAGGISSTSHPQPTELPPPVLSFYRSILGALRSSFPTAPPFTIQRLAELIQHPRQHYKTLPAYLRALDRAVAVSSPATSFPLPVLASMDESGGTYLAGGSAPADDFNAAALTRIPWLKEGGGPAAAAGQGAGGSNVGGAPTSPGGGAQRTTDLHTARTERIEGPHGAGSVETVTVGSQRGGFVGGGHFGHAVAGNAGGGGRAASQHIPASDGNGNASSDPELAQAPTLPSNAPEAESTGPDSAMDVESRGSQPQPAEARSPPAAAAVRSPPTTTITPPPPSSSSSSSSPPQPSSSSDDLLPHARGPSEIGMADMGPQPRPRPRTRSPVDNASSPGVADAENALGRPGEAETVSSPTDPDRMIRSPRMGGMDGEMLGEIDDVVVGKKEKKEESEGEGMDVENEV
jgi:PPP4R2